MSRVAVGLAGLGRMGRIHAAALTGRCATASLACVFDASPDTAQAVGAEFDVPWTASYDELLDRVDAVAIASPPGTHAPLTPAAAAAGVHVFCEKPISLDRATTVETLDAVEAAGIVFQVGFHRRSDPDWAAAAARIHAG